jgi:protein-arginine kinase activator protein McsA
MIKIFNTKLDVQINIELEDWVTFTPLDYQDVPNVIIELKNGFDFSRHARQCDDCGKFLSEFGSNTLDWYISYSGKIKRLDLSTLNSKEYYNNQIVFTNSEHDYGTKLKLMIHSLSTDKNDIQEYLERVLKNEDYETACKIRDLDKVD